MGGMEGSRGYVYQGIVSVIKALTEPDWDRIQIELPTDGDKVDIALSQGSRVVKAIQVKSTINSFSLLNLKTWTQELIADYPCACYEIVLLGQCEKDANDFIKALDKYYLNALDKQAKRILKGFDTSILDRAKISIHKLPFDQETLLASTRDALFRYVSADGTRFEFEQISLLAGAAIGEHLISSTNGSYIDRGSFEAIFRTRIKLLSSQIPVKRVPLCICSFDRGVKECISFSDNNLDMRQFFTGRRISSGYRWDRDIIPKVEQFFSRFGSSNKYAVYLETHTSIAFAAGRFCDSKSGLDIVPFQKTFSDGMILWPPDQKTIETYPGWNVEQTILSDSDQSELALIINGTHEIYGDVISFIEQAKLPVGKVLSCAVSGRGVGHQSIIDGYHACQLANEISSILDRRTSEEKRGNLHLFISAPNAFTFYLGKLSWLFGKINLYEYDRGAPDGVNYIHSFSF